MRKHRSNKEEKQIYLEVQMSHRGKEGDKERGDEGQRTNPVEIKRRTKEKKTEGQEHVFNELNEVIISKDLILQDFSAQSARVRGGGGRQKKKAKTGQDVYRQEPFDNVDRNIKVRSRSGRRTGSVRARRRRGKDDVGRWRAATQEGESDGGLKDRGTL